MPRPALATHVTASFRYADIHDSRHNEMNDEDWLTGLAAVENFGT
jgi:hypothetical protein